MTKSWADSASKMGKSVAIACLKVAVGTLMTEWSFGI